MSYFFQISSLHSNGMVFITPEYLCEETTKANLLSLSLPSFYKIKYYYGKWYDTFSLYTSTNEFLYEVTKDSYSFAPDLNNIVSGKYFLIIYAIR